MKYKKLNLVTIIILGLTVFNLSFHSIQGFTSLYSENQSNINQFDNLQTSLGVSKLWEITNYSQWINDVRISADGNYIASTNYSKLEFFDKSNPAPLWTFTAESFIRQLEMSDDGRYILIMVRYDIFLFDSTQADPEQPVWSLYNAEWFGHIAISADGSRIAAMSLGSNDTLFLLNNVNNNSIWTCHLGDTMNYIYRSIGISDNGEYISIILQNGTICLFNDTASISKKPIWTYDTGITGLRVEMSADGSSIVAIASRWSSPEIGKIFLFNNTLTTPKVPVWIFETFYVFDSVYISKDGTYIAAGRGTNATLFPTLFLFNSASNVPLWNYTENEQWYGFMNLVFTSDGNYLVTSTYAVTSVFAFNTTASDSKNYMWHHTGQVTSMDMSHDGKYLIVARESYSQYILTLYNLDFSNGGSNGGTGTPPIPGFDPVLLIGIGFVLSAFLFRKKYKSKL